MKKEDHDPFPMTSREADALQSTVPSSGSDWNKMATTTGGIKSTNKSKSSSSKTQESTSLTGETKKYSDDVDSSDEEGLEYEDDYLDRPINQNRFITGLQKVFQTIFTKLYGNTIPVEEIQRVMILSSVLFFMIGGYWLLRSLKDPVITALCGVEAIPKAKFLSVFVVLGVIYVYNSLLDSSLPKYQIFFIFGMFYFGLFTGIAYLLTHPTIGLPNQAASPDRILGWVNYCGIESFGSVMVSLFWSFANSNISVGTAKASYGFVVATAQIGSIIGPTFVSIYAEMLGVPTCYFLGALCMLALQGCMAFYVYMYGGGEEEQPAQNKGDKPKKKAGVLEGLWLIMEHKYIAGMFVISSFFMIQVTIVDYTMKVLAKDHFTAEHPCLPGATCWDSGLNAAVGMSDEATAAFATFLGVFGQATNTLSFFMSLLGTSAVIRTLGLNRTLVLFPALLIATMVVVWAFPNLWIVFAAMMFLKALTYALNNPTKEILYQPTASAVKYKAKSWIDMFGARGSKALGSVFTNAFSDSADKLVTNGSIVSILVGVFLFWNARYMGTQFDEYMESGHIVGETEEKQKQEELLEMAVKQNEDEDTSCAIYEGAGDKDVEKNDESK